MKGSSKRQGGEIGEGGGRGGDGWEGGGGGELVVCLFDRC